MLRSNALASWISLGLIAILIASCGGGSDDSNGDSLDLSLNSLTFSEGDLEPSFDPTKSGPYELNVSAETESVDITAVLTNDSYRLSVLSWKYQGGVATSESKEIESGNANSLSLAPGNNPLQIQIFDEESNTALTYDINIHRISSNASLNTVELVESATASALTLSPAFSYNVLDYTATAPYDSCAVSLETTTEAVNTTIDINGQEALHQSNTIVGLNVGENTINLVTTPESGGAGETYKIVVTRSNPTDDELAANARLKTLSVDTGELTSSFYCSLLNYTMRINKEESSFRITAEPSVEGATLMLFDVGTDDDGNVTYDNGQPMVSGEAFEIPVGSEDFRKAVRVTATNTTSVNNYLITVNRLSTNRRNVSTATELQQALKAAKPGDEIILEKLTYSGEASVEASGHSEAHFYSDASGTFDDPIIIRGNRATLEGNALESRDVLRISGSHWVVSQLDITKARNGVVLDGASHVSLQGLSIEDVGERGVIMQNGSSDNELLGSWINKTGQASRENIEHLGEAVVIGSNGSDWISAPSPGGFNEVNNDNAIRNNNFGSTIPAEVIDVKEGVLRTQIQFNTFSSAGTSAATSSSTSVAVLKGNDTNVSFNTFSLEGVAPVTQLLTISDADADWHTTEWGSSTEVYQNFAALDDTATAFVNNTGGVTFVADNTREDENDVVYSGENVNREFTTPSYKVGAGTLCVGAESIEALEVIILQECESAPAWIPVYGSAGFVQLVPATNLDFFITPLKSSFTSDVGAAVLRTRVESVNKGFMTMWLVSFNSEGEVELYNKASRNSYTLSVLNGTLEKEQPLVVWLSNAYGAEAQNFTLIPQ